MCAMAVCFSGSSKSDMKIASIVSTKTIVDDLFSEGDTGAWAVVDDTKHHGCAIVVWRSAYEKRSPECEFRARKIAAADAMFDLLHKQKVDMQNEIIQGVEAHGLAFYNFALYRHLTGQIGKIKELLDPILETSHVYHRN